MIDDTVEYIGRILHEQADRLTRLADELNQEGRPLDQSERELVRMAYLPLFQDMLADITKNFLSGSYSNMGKSMDCMMNEVKNVIRII
jgi:hypothetical protein